MKQGLRMRCRRITSGFLAFTMTAILVLGDAGAAFASTDGSKFYKDGSDLGGEGYSMATSSNASFKNHSEDEVVMSIFSSDDSDFRAGGTFFLDVHLKNETGTTITNGVLDFTGKKLRESGAYFEDPKEDVVSDGIIEIDEEPEEEGAGTQIQDLENDRIDGELDMASFDTSFAQDEEDGKDNAIEAGETGKKENKAEEEEEDEEEEELLQKLEGIELAPGQIYTARFVCEVDEDLEKAKNMHVNFRFRGETEEKKINKQEKFQYVANHLNMGEIRFEDGNEVKTGETVTMGIHTSMFDFDSILTNKKVEDELLASASNAGAATPSNAQTATPSNTDEDEEWEEEDNDDFVVDLGKVKYEIQMINAKLNDFEIRDALVSDANENMMVCSFRVSKKVNPGVYFGKVIQKTKEKSKTYTSSQGFALIVNGDGDVTLETKVEGSDAIVTVSGPVDSFPDADQLAVAAKEITVMSEEIAEDSDKMEQVQNAIEKKAQEENIDVKAFKALDIKLYADGQEVEPTGPIRVAFKNVKLEDKLASVEAASEEAMEEAAAEESKNPIAKLFEVFSADKGQKADEVVTAEEAVAKAAEENSESKVEVWHLPDESEEIGQTFEVSTDEETGDVVMDTDHFSIYIVVNVGNELKEITVTVKHTAEVDQWLLDGDNKLKEPVVGDRMYPGAKPDGTYDHPKVSIYADDIGVKIPNGSGTGVGYEVMVKNWSKVALGGNYEVKQVTVTGSGRTVTLVDNHNDNSKQKIDLKNGDIIEIEYTPKSGTMSGYAAFHDYNVTVIEERGGDDTHRGGLNTIAKGMNSRLSGLTNPIAIGNDGMLGSNIRHGKGGIYPNKLDAWTTGKTGIAKEVTNGGKGDIVFNYGDPGLFSKGDIKIGNYFAKAYLPNYKLNFKKTGDTYILQSVQDSDGITVVNNLDKLQKSHNTPLYSNLFWPLDMGVARDSKYGVDGKTRDPLFGGLASDRTMPTKDDYNNYDAEYNFNLNDEFLVKNNPYIKHNWFFGMRYDFEFNIGDYMGPMNYYFRGDDDFWLFIDGKLVSNVDLGGIHTSIGKYVDLKAWMNANLSGGAAGKHRMSVFFMERGGYGSCCYMAFTLPNVQTIPTPDAEVTEATVTKRWYDNHNAGGKRPQYIYVQLYQNGEAFGNAVKLEGGKTADTWTYTWKNLPKYRDVGGSRLHSYTAKEVSTPPGYNKSEDGMTIKNIKLTEVSITKQWSSGAPKSPVKVGLFKNDTERVKEIITLREGSWTGKWPDLPMYDTNGNAISYTPYEVDSQGKKINGNASITPADNNGNYTQGNDGKYIVTYGSGNTIVKNTYNYKTISVKKEWEDYQNAYKTRPSEIKVQLYRNGSKYRTDEIAVLNEKNSWSYTWKNLPIKANGTATPYTYTVKELDKDGTPVEANGKPLFTSTDGKIYQYQATYPGGTGASGNPFKIKNALRPAVLRLKKIVIPNGLSHEPIDGKYKFLIRLRDADGNIHTAVALGHNETSEAVFLVPPAAGEKFTVEEIVPMEYTLVRTEGKPDGKLNGNEVTVVPGDDITVTFINQPDHEGYFHHTYSVTNENAHGTGFYPIETNRYDEPHGNEKADTKAPASPVAWLSTRDNGRKFGEEESLEGDEDLYA